MNNSFVHVAVAAIVNDKDEVLVSQRKQDSHLGGYWEFPGGKLEPGETFESALCRELKEELDIVPLSRRPLIRTRYHYPEKSVLLEVWKVESFTGNPRGIEGQQIEWRTLNSLEHKHFPSADIPIINSLLLPSRYLITGEFSSAADFKQRLVTALSDGIKLVQLRLTHDWVTTSTESYVLEIAEICKNVCRQNAARLMFNVPEELEFLVDDGVHLNSRQLLAINARPDTNLVSASCHNRQELEHAQSIGVDFAVLSPVLKTRSHPHADPLGWVAFHELVDHINIPVFALGGVTDDDIEQAWKSGGQGIAAISALWK